MQRHLGLWATLILFGVAAGSRAQGVGDFRKGEWRPQDIPDGYSATSIGRYQFQSSLPKDVIARIGKHMNAMFKVYSRHYPSTKTPRENLVIKVFPNRKAYSNYGAPPGTGGYYSPLDREMVGYYTGVLGGESAAPRTTGSSSDSTLAKIRKRLTIDTIGVFSHEGWHQYFHWSCGSQVPFPAWCDEGIGEYYYPAWLKGDELILGAPNDYRLPVIQDAIARDQHVPLKELIRYEQREYYRNPGVCYAEGWALVHFFFEHPDWKAKSFVQKFVAVFKDQHSIEKTLDIACKGMDWDAIEKDFKAWTMAIPAEPIDEDADDEESSFLRSLLGPKDRYKKYYDALRPDVKKALDSCIARRRSAFEKPVAEKPAAVKPGALPGSK